MATFREFSVPEKNFEVKAGDRLQLTPKQVSLRGQDLEVLTPAMVAGGPVDVRVKRPVTFNEGEVIGLFVPPPPPETPAAPVAQKAKTTPVKAATK